MSEDDLKEIEKQRREVIASDPSTWDKRLVLMTSAVRLLLEEAAKLRQELNSLQQSQNTRKYFNGGRRQHGEGGD